MDVGFQRTKTRVHAVDQHFKAMDGLRLHAVDVLLVLFGFGFNRDRAFFCILDSLILLGNGFFNPRHFFTIGHAKSPFSDG